MGHCRNYDSSLSYKPEFMCHSWNWIPLPGSYVWPYKRATQGLFPNGSCRIKLILPTRTKFVPSVPFISVWLSPSAWCWLPWGGFPDCHCSVRVTSFGWLLVWALSQPKRGNKEARFHTMSCADILSVYGFSNLCLKTAFKGNRRSCILLWTNSWRQTRLKQMDNKINHLERKKKKKSIYKI